MISLQYRKVDGIEISYLVCDRNEANEYFRLLAIQNSAIDGSDLHYEVTLLIKRLRKSIYYPCEATGELRLLNSLCIYEGKIVSTLYRRSCEARKKAEEKMKARQQKQLKREQAKQAKAQRKLARERKQRETAEALAERKRIATLRCSMTAIERAVFNGEATVDEVNEILQSITFEEIKEEVSLLTKRWVLDDTQTEEEARKIVLHSIAYRKWNKLRAKRKVQQMIESGFLG